MVVMTVICTRRHCRFVDQAAANETVAQEMLREHFRLELTRSRLEKERANKYTDCAMQLFQLQGCKDLCSTWPFE